MFFGVGGLFRVCLIVALGFRVFEVLGLVGVRFLSRGFGAEKTLRFCWFWGYSF